MAMTREQHFDRELAPKRMLSLDGGGIRGILTLEYLGVLEALLRTRHGRADLRLSDYFDLIGGTSTGAIIAAALACGMSVDQLKTLYRQIGTDVFATSPLRLPFVAAKFPASRVQAVLNANLGANVTLGDDAIRTGLMIMAKRLDNSALWSLHNHPGSVYAAQDHKLLLSQVVRASTAAPTYFAPERITLKTRTGAPLQGVFVDGGVSPFNDPALQLLMVAILHQHGFRWRTGREQLLIVSVGTGSRRSTAPADEVMRMLPAEQGVRSLKSLMDDCQRVNQMMLQWLSATLTPWTIDAGIGDMHKDSEDGPNLATYVRYNVLLEREWMEHELDLQYDDARLKAIAEMDNTGSMQELSDIGQRAATRQVKAEHLPAAFDANV
ncbi:hypothetical protein LMG28688_06488 [Paraburkholderia caffeinitolerans]|uniref:PNPLA domain-containing protein n=1 Tax=Paraburkholderia caffeinitolerans TaxID=1723730 RepID=A0A6J5GVQ0_9BURK|nr:MULTISPECIES: patatin-like phospholipase family protein [Paraburkholderia]CAB3807129.1 hypothetical protein LMG28688_06488 [Paraburkholderia caffeinitolerans]